MKSINAQIDERIPIEQERILSEIKKYLEVGNKKGNERRIISIGQSLVKYDLSFQKSYITMLCESDYPIAAAMTLNSMHHEDIDTLKEIILRNIDILDWSLYDKIISFLYIKSEEKLLDLLNSLEDVQALSLSINNILEYLVGQSEYELIFNLIYMIAKSSHSSILRSSLYKLQINEFYIKQYSIPIQKSAQILHEKKDYDSLFMLCKNLKILQHLKMILQKDSDELENEFIKAESIAGIRLAFRIVQQELKDDEKAYTIMISKLSNMNKFEKIQYIYFCYLLKLIQIQKKVNLEVKEEIKNIGEVKLLRGKIYAIELLAKCLEIVLINQGLEAYYEFVKILDVNHIFKYERNFPKIMPYWIYKNESLENILTRKAYFHKLNIKEECNEKGLFHFYMNSFYKYLLSIHDFFEAVYREKEDRVYLRKLCYEHVFYGKIKSINLEKGTALAIFHNVAFKYKILITKKEVGENHINLLQKEDEFSFKLNKFNPRSGYISITNFKLLDTNRQKQFDDVDVSYWEDFRCCLKDIILYKKFSSLEKEKLEAIPHIKFKNSKFAEEYLILYSEVLFGLRYKVDEIIDLINALEKNNNNIFNTYDPLIFINITEELLNRANETIKCIISQSNAEKDLIFIYVNTYLRLTVKVQLIFKAMIKPGEDSLRLDSRFYEYRFYGRLSNYVHVNEKGIKSGAVRTKSIQSYRSMSFILDKECGITEKMIEDESFVSFRLRKYFRIHDGVAIEDVRSIERKNQIKLKNWNVVHNCNKLIKHNRSVFKETLEELKELPKLNLIKVEAKRFYPDFFWCINNLSKNEDDLFLYLKSLGINNPYYYVPGEFNKTFREFEENFSFEQSRAVIQQLVENNYNLHKILWIYLNSYLCNKIPIHNVLEEYYENGNSKKIYYMPRKIQEILFLATVSSIRNNMLVLYFKQAYCKCRVHVRLEDSSFTEIDFIENQEVMVMLSEYHKDENIIYVELYE